MRRKQRAALLAVPVLCFLLPAVYLHLTRDVFSDDAAFSPPPPPPPPSPPSVTHHRHHRQNLAIREHLPSSRIHLLSSSPPDSILLPDWEVLLLDPNRELHTQNGTLSCIFQNGRATPAVPAGYVPSTGRAAFRCSLPPSVHRLRPFYTPRLSSPAAPGGDRREMLRWNRLAYESLSTPRDVIVFAKGINNRQGVNHPASSLSCVFLLDGAAVASTPATSSAQEVFRCPHPPAPRLPLPLTVSLSLAGGQPPYTIPSVAAYLPPPPDPAPPNRKLVCACTMVYNVAKFLKEWVAYHSAVGVERFVLYDNGSEDELNATVGGLTAAGYDVSTRFWPWPKTQEAGFSHCAVAEADSCEWVAFIDVDEFIFAKPWAGFARPADARPSMLRALLPAEKSRVGQVVVSCRDFGPSGRREHPAEGVTQGYTCRRRVEERHKALVRVAAVADGSLVNSVHHFGAVADGWRTRRSRAAVVNHYKYQAWREFRVKFRRRVSAYVADWRDRSNPRSKDRAPGLGNEPVEPTGWANRFCEVNDTALRDTARRWFSEVGPDKEYRMLWED